MISLRSRQLQQLGIIQWILRRPRVLQGEIAISLPAHTRLVMVADEFPELNESLIGDVLLALNVSADQVLQITPDRMTTLSLNSYCNNWSLLGGKEVPSLEGAQLISPSLKELQNNPSAKRALWEQICKYEHNFFPCDI